MNRRQFIASAGAATATFVGAHTAQAAVDARRDPARFGLDLWSVRSQGWSAFQYIDHAVEQKLSVIQFADQGQLGGFDLDLARKVRAYADEKGILLEMGMETICPTSTGWSPERGRLEDRILRYVEISRILGSPVLRCFLGSARDRQGALPLQHHIDAMLATLRNVRNQVTDAGVKMAIENHSGDMQGRELAQVIEEAGKDWVGVVYDSGNPIWTIEDPMVALEHLAPYILTTHLRDSYVWISDEGVAARWVVFGEGNVGMPAVLQRMRQLCPQATVLLETITVRHNDLPVKRAAYWKHYEDVPAHEFMRFYALAEKGVAQAPLPQLTREQMAVRQLQDSNLGLVNIRKMFAAA